MKKCPSCGELLGTYADTCFKCGFDYGTGNSSATSLEAKIKKEVAVRTLSLLEEQEDRIGEVRRKINDKYEYAVEIITDKSDGGTDFDTLNKTLRKYSERGWRLVNTFTNELGETSHYDKSLNTRINSTMDQVVLIFERRTITSQHYVECLKTGENPEKEENDIITDTIQRIAGLREEVEQEYKDKSKLLENAKLIREMPVKDLILSALEKEPDGITAQDIVEKYDSTRNTMDVLTYLQKMVNDGIVEKDGVKYKKK